MSMANETMNLSEKDDTNFFVRVKIFYPVEGRRSRRSVQKDSVRNSLSCFSVFLLMSFQIF